MELKEIERAIIKRYRTKLYSPFIRAIQEYDLIQENDCIGVCISGGKDSLLMAKLFQELLRHSDYPFRVKFLVMNPGFNQENLDKLKENCETLNIPIIIKNSNIFSAAYNMDNEHPCYLCARMRRGFLYEFAKDEGCNKIALGHHFNDVIETTLMNILYAGNFKTMPPKLKATNFKGMELIRPLVYITEQDIITYMNYCEITPMSCGCPVAKCDLPSKRKDVKKLIQEIKKDFPNVDINIYRSAQNVNLNCVLGWKIKDEYHNFLEHYDDED